MEPLPTQAPYNFVTECFFLTHQALRVGFHAVHEKLVKLNQDLHRVQRLYQEVRAQAGSDQDDLVQSIKVQMEKGKHTVDCHFSFSIICQERNIVAFI